MQARQLTLTLTTVTVFAFALVSMIKAPSFEHFGSAQQTVEQVQVEVG